MSDFPFGEHRGTHSVSISTALVSRIDSVSPLIESRWRDDRANERRRFSEVVRECVSEYAGLSLLIIFFLDMLLMRVLDTAIRYFDHASGYSELSHNSVHH